MSNARIYARNLAANWIGHGANLVVLFFLSPFVIHTLGQVEYAIWSLVTVLTGYMGILDLGVRASTGRHIFLYLGKKDHEKVDATIRTGLGFYSLVGLLILGAGVVLGWCFPSIFTTVPAEYHHVIGYLLPLMALNVWIGAFASVFSSVLAAHERFDLARGVDLFILVLRTLGTVLALTWGYGIVGLAVVVIGCNVVAVLGNWLLAGRVYPRLRIWPLMFSGERVRELLGYGMAAFIISISIKIIGQSDLVIVGMAIGVPEVTVYSVGAMLLYYSQTLLGQISTTFFPSVQKAAARGELGPVRWLFRRQVRLSLMLGLPMYIGFIMFGRPFIRLWMLGPAFPEAAVETAATVMAILAASKLAYLMVIGSDGVLNAMGHIRFNASLTLIEAVLNLALSLVFVLVLQWGLAGVAAGTLAARLFVRTFAVPWYACRKMGMNWWNFLTQIGGSGVAAGALFAAWCLLVRTWSPADSWPIFAGQVVIALIGYIPVAFLILLSAEDRKRLVAKLRPVAAREI